MSDGDAPLNDDTYESPSEFHSSRPQVKARATALRTTKHARSRSRNAMNLAVFSPRSSNYERLEGGMGPTRLGAKKFAWKKFAIGAVVLIGLVWAFGPRERRQTWLGGSKGVDYSQPDLSDIDYDPNPPPVTLPNDAEVPPAKTRPVDTHPVDTKPVDTKPAVLRPTSPETDPDLLKTVYCTKPHNPSSRLVQYALMIDAGSTGSRIHIYKFHNCGPSPTYEYEVFKQTKPGLSSYKGKPLEAARSLDVLLDEAVKVVPESLRKCTPVAVKATAGLRLLGAAESAEILEAVKHRLQSVYPFPIQGDDAVVIMDGKDEGVFAWITANYLSNTIRADSPKGIPPYAVLDLGGASTQIVFEPSFKEDSSLADGDHKYELLFGGKQHVLYQHSYLGYGLMRARSSVHKVVEFLATLKNAGPTIANPCLAKGTKREVEIEDERSKEKRKVTMVGEDVGSYEACNRVMQLVLAKDAICELKPCAFDGVYQPSVLDTFPAGAILLLSYFYDRLQPLLESSPPPKVTVSTIATLAEQICQGKSAWEELWGAQPELMVELDDRPEWCLDLTFMHALLRLGYEFEDDREVMIGKQIEGTELGWALGAGIALVGGELKCSV